MTDETTSKLLDIVSDSSKELGEEIRQLRKFMIWLFVANFIIITVLMGGKTAIEGFGLKIEAEAPASESSVIISPDDLELEKEVKLDNPSPAATAVGDSGVDTVRPTP